MVFLRNAFYIMADHEWFCRKNTRQMTGTYEEMKRITNHVQGGTERTNRWKKKYILVVKVSPLFCENPRCRCQLGRGMEKNDRRKLRLYALWLRYGKIMHAEVTNDSKYIMYNEFLKDNYRGTYLSVSVHVRQAEKYNRRSFFYRLAFNFV